MRRLQVADLEGPAALHIAEVDAPQGDGGVVIDVHTAGVTYPDLLMTRGMYQIRPEPPFAPGLEVAGVVRSAPADAGVAAGDRVAAYTGWGGYSEVVAVPAFQVVPLPDAVDFGFGVTLMVNYQTAYFALAERGRLAAGETLLVQGAAGGVGTAAIQVGLSLGARVLAVVRGDQKEAVARDAGAEEIIRAESDWRSEVKRLTDGRGVDAVFDPVGGDRCDESLRLLATDGRLLVIGFAEGRIPQIPANYLLLKNIEAVGVAWGMYVEKDHETPRRVGAALARMIEDGYLKPVIGATYPLAEGARALTDLDERRTVGKTVLEVR
jgi:NADPH2:quinone reductase